MRGFSLLEVLIYTAIIGIVGSLFSGILLSVTRIQNQQNAAAEVNQQLNFVINNIQRLIRESSYIDIAAGAVTSTLTLKMRDSAKDPTIITVANGKVTLQQGGASPLELTTSAVTVDKLAFLKITNYPGHDSVQIDVTLSHNTSNPQMQFTKSLTSAVARVSAATFDSDIVPGTDNAYDVGLGSARWQDLNLSGEIKIGGISTDGTGKVACVKSDGNLGTCSTVPNASGVCTCN
ncbi:MAG: type II secretion system protein [Candidatus Harrisonbacteria bacterium]|nr:type II secretion system protein [Candidatus Harrisonbacteria bacterium]